jgi:hypothetical protein
MSVLHFVHVGAHKGPEQRKQNKTKMEREIFVCTLFRAQCGQPLMGTVGWIWCFGPLNPNDTDFALTCALGFFHACQICISCPVVVGVASDWLWVGRSYLSSSSKIDCHYQHISPLDPITESCIKINLTIWCEAMQVCLRLTPWFRLMKHFICNLSQLGDIISSRLQLTSTKHQVVTFRAKTTDLLFQMHDNNTRKINILRNRCPVFDSIWVD